MRLHLIQLGEHDWITIDDARQPRHIIHRGPHVVERETLIEYRVVRWALERGRRELLGWAETLREAEAIARAEWDEQEGRRRAAIVPTRMGGVNGPAG